MLSLNNKIEANDFGKDKKLILNLNSDIPIIIVNGCGGVGKDEFVKSLDELITVFSYSTIDTYKKIAKESFDWDEVKDEKGRKLLSDLKLAGINYNDAPLKEFKDVYTDINRSCLADVFTCMCRDIGEIKKIKNEFPDTITVLVTNNRVQHISSNVADDNVYNYQYDYIINNDSTIDVLKESAKTFILDVFGKYFDDDILDGDIYE